MLSSGKLGGSYKVINNSFICIQKLMKVGRDFALVSVSLFNTEKRNCNENQM